MTKLVIGLAVVVVVVLIIVILAARNRRAEHPEGAAQRSGGRNMAGRDRHDWRDEDGRGRSVRHPARDGRASLHQDDGPRRPAGRRDASQRRADAPADGEPGYGEPGGPDAATRVSSGGRDRARARDGRGSAHEAGHGSRSGHHGAGSHGYDGARDRKRASVPADRGTDRRDSEASPRPRPEAPAASRTRPGRSRRSDDSADWPSTEWDKLSDVDYWAELASDKPLTTTAQPAAPARPGQQRDAQAGAAYGAVAGPAAASGIAPGGDALSTRRLPQMAAAPVPPSALPLPRPVAAAGYHPDDPTIDQGGDAGRGRRRIPGSLDDDPLTSPSFPRVPADDSRSFRSSRGPALSSSQEAAQNAPTQQFASYQSQAPQSGPPAAGDRGRLSAYPDSYPAGSGSHARPGPGAGPANGGASSTTGPVPLPSGNPYGSYVGNLPSDGYPTRPAPDLNGHRGAPYPAASDLNGYRSAPYPPAQEPDRYREGSYPPTAGPDSQREWYPQPSPSPLPRHSNGAAGPGPSESEAPGTGRRGRDGHYYPPDYRPGGYPSARPGQDGYLPPGGYPGAPAVPYAQDPYGPDGYGRQSGY